jgi:hypothetical protein
MGRFAKAVQDGAILGPLRSGFKMSRWREEHAKLGDDDEDQNLLDAGVLIYDKADHIRSALKLTFSNKLKATTKVRAFAALANYNLCALYKKTQESLEQLAATQRDSYPGAPLMMHELAAVKVELPVGAQFSPDEIVQSMVDGMEVPLKRILEVNPDLVGNPQFGKMNWDDALNDFNLGYLYSHIESLWDECLWNNYKTVNGGVPVTFSPSDKFWLVRAVTSRVRFSSLSREFAVHAQNAQRQLSESGRLATLGLLNVKAVSKDGRRQSIQLVPFDIESRYVNWLFTMRAYASEPYYAELLSEPQVMLKGATLNQLLTGWIVVSAASHYLRELVEARDVKEVSEPNTWLPNYAPILQKSALSGSISSASKASLEQSVAMVDFLVFFGKAGQELWAQPLLPVSKEAVVPIFATTSSPNLRRLLDVWLKQLGVDLSLRGQPFEAHIRASIRKNISLSPLLSGKADCLEHGVKFTPSGEREEQIDVVAVVGDAVIIGEAKCLVEPAEAKQTAMHRVKVIDAVAQVKRKAMAITRNKKQFQRRVSQLGLALPENFTVLPAVILNSAIHCGVAVDGVPVVDEHILSGFFRGELIDMAMQDADGTLKTIRKNVLYVSAADAPNALAKYLLFPPQMTPLLAGVVERWVPIPAIDEGDWFGQFLALDCKPNVAPLTESEEAAAGRAPKKKN